MAIGFCSLPVVGTHRSERFAVSMTRLRHIACSILLCITGRNGGRSVTILVRCRVMDGRSLLRLGGLGSQASAALLARRDRQAPQVRKSPAGRSRGTQRSLCLPMARALRRSI